MVKYPITLFFLAMVPWCMSGTYRHPPALFARTYISYCTGYSMAAWVNMSENLFSAKMHFSNRSEKRLELHFDSLKVYPIDFNSARGSSIIREVCSFLLMITYTVCSRNTVSEHDRLDSSRARNRERVLSANGRSQWAPYPSAVYHRGVIAAGLSFAPTARV